MTKKELHKLEVGFAKLRVTASRVVTVYDRLTPADNEHFKFLIDDLRKVLLDFDAAG